MQRIIALACRASARGERLCLATVVHVEGSSYRKPGARMLVSSSGERAGTISGGCLESEVSRKAWWLTANGARMEKYSSFADEDGGMPYGLGCGGVVSLLLEQGGPALAVLAALERASEMQERSVVIIALGAGLRPLATRGALLQESVHEDTASLAGTLLVLTERDSPENADGLGASALRWGALTEDLEVAYERMSLQGCSVEGQTSLGGEEGKSLDPEARREALISAAQLAFRQRQSCYLDDDLRVCAGDASSLAYFVEYLAPSPALTIFGAGDDAQPIADLAHTLGWRVTVVDGRAHLARCERFPHAAEVRVLNYADPALRVACGVGPAGEESVQSNADGRRRADRMTCDFIAGQGHAGIVRAKNGAVTELSSDEIAVILTHSYEQDRAVLTALLPRRLRYLGILGPRLRTERLLEEVTPLLGMSVEEGFARVHSPIGLDLGAGDPAAVALSIVAEIQAVLQGREVAITRSGERVALQLAAD